MAVFKNGPNGSFSGKVGSVVGYKWKGIDVIRGLPRKSHKPRSEARLANEQAMKVIMEALKPLRMVIRTGFRGAAESLNMTAFNFALSLNKKNALRGEYPNIEMDWAKFSISQGELPGAEAAAATWNDTGLHISWQNNVGQGNAYGTDQLAVLVYSHAKNVWINFLNQTTRDTCACTLPPNEHWKGTEVEVYLFFVSFGSEWVSDSSHIHVAAKNGLG